MIVNSSVLDCCTSVAACKLQLFLLLVSNISTNTHLHVQQPQSERVITTTDRIFENSIPKSAMANLSQLPVQSNHFWTTLAGVQMPKLIYGTAWKKEKTAELVVTAIRAGFRGIDTACQPKHYFEPGVGAALKTLATKHGIPRENLFIQTKFTSLDGQDPNNIPYDKSADLSTQVQQSLAVSLKNLGTTYIDSLVLHGPLRTHEKTMQVWRTFEDFVDEGKVRQLGMSNCYDEEQFTKIFQEARIKPAVLQNRFYQDSGHDKYLREYCKKNGVIYQSFWTLTGNPQVLENVIVTELSKKYGKTAEQVFFAYLIGIGFAPLTGTKNEVHMKQDLEALDLTLTPEENKVFENFFK